MKQLILEKEPQDGGLLTLEGDVFHYLVRVRRLQEGHILSALTPGGVKGRLLIQRIRTQSLEAAWNPSLVKPQDQKLRITLNPALLKGGKLDDVLRMAVEAGIREWQPWIAHYSIPRPQTGKRLARWERIAKESLQQSGRTQPVKVHDPIGWDQARETWSKQDKVLVFHHLENHSRPLHEALMRVKERVSLVFGPEGGLSQTEVEFFSSLDSDFIWLGPGILRSETAVIFALGAVQIFEQEGTLWKTPSSDN